MMKRNYLVWLALCIVFGCGITVPVVIQGEIVHEGGATLFTLLSPQPYLNDANHPEPSVIFPGNGRVIVAARGGLGALYLRQWHNDDPGFAQSGIVTDGDLYTGADLPSMLESPGVAGGKRYLFHTGPGQTLNIYAKIQPITSTPIGTWTDLNNGNPIITHTTTPNTDPFNNMYNINPMIDPVDPTLIHLWIEGYSDYAQGLTKEYQNNNPTIYEEYGYGNMYTRLQINEADGSLTELTEWRSTGILFHGNHSNPIYDSTTNKILFVAHHFEYPFVEYGNDGWEICDIKAWILPYGTDPRVKANYRAGSFRIYSNNPPPRPSFPDPHLYKFPEGQGFTHKLLLLAVPSVGSTDYRINAWVSDATLAELINEIDTGRRSKAFNVRFFGGM